MCERGMWEPTFVYPAGSDRKHNGEASDPPAGGRPRPDENRTAAVSYQKDDIRVCAPIRQAMPMVQVLPQGRAFPGDSLRGLGKLRLRRPYQECQVPQEGRHCRRVHTSNSVAAQ